MTMTTGRNPNGNGFFQREWIPGMKFKSCCLTAMTPSKLAGVATLKNHTLHRKERTRLCASLQNSAAA